MEIFDTAGPEAKGNEKVMNSRIAKNALKFFLAGATIVFGIAMYYCYSTGHKAETGALGGGYAILLFMASRIYRTS